MLNLQTLSSQITLTDTLNRKVTPPKINVEPENTILEKEKHLQTTNSWVSCLVFGGAHIEIRRFHQHAQPVAPYPTPTHLILIKEPLGHRNLELFCVCNGLNMSVFPDPCDSMRLPTYQHLPVRVLFEPLNPKGWLFFFRHPLSSSMKRTPWKI